MWKRRCHFWVFKVSSVRLLSTHGQPVTDVFRGEDELTEFVRNVPNGLNDILRKSETGCFAGLLTRTIMAGIHLFWECQYFGLYDRRLLQLMKKFLSFLKFNWSARYFPFLHYNAVILFARIRLTRCRLRCFTFQCLFEVVCHLFVRAFVKTVGGRVNSWQKEREEIGFLSFEHVHCLSLRWSLFCRHCVCRMFPLVFLCKKNGKVTFAGKRESKETVHVGSTFSECSDDLIFFSNGLLQLAIWLVLYMKLHFYCGICFLVLVTQIIYFAYLCVWIFLKHITAGFVKSRHS